MSGQLARVGAISPVEAAPQAGTGPARAEPVPTPAMKRIRITSPPDGLSLAPDDPPIVVVEGEMEDATVPTVWVVANDLRIAVAVQSGRFRRALVVPDSTLRIHAEVHANGETTHRSSTVAVHSPSSSEFGIVMIDWPEAGVGHEVDLTGTWRSSPERVDAPTRTFPLRAVAGLNAGSTQAFYFRRPKPGVYSFDLRYRATSAARMLVPTLYLPRAGQLARLVARPIVAHNPGPLSLGRVLLPYGVLWEQDEWFTGRIESVDTITKFRMPEGVTWAERRAGFR
ncbi:MAG: hypothetical protein ACRELA_16135 [Candidatus Rokuibacteriota bacterium]